MGGTNKYLIPQGNYRDDLHWIAYAEEADILNVALVGFTAKAWRDANPEFNRWRTTLKKIKRINMENSFSI